MYSRGFNRQVVIRIRVDRDNGEGCVVRADSRIAIVERVELSLT